MLDSLIPNALNTFSKGFTEIALFRKDLPSVEESANASLGFEIGPWRESDAIFFSKSSFHGTNDLGMLLSADLCVVARHDGRPIHYTCVALKSFLHPRIHEEIRLDSQEAYIYGVQTNDAYRGLGIAPKVFGYIHEELEKRDVLTVFSHVWVGNVGSQKTFLKSGYVPYGRLYLTHAGRGYFWLVRADRSYFCGRSLFSLPSLKLYRANKPELPRISIEITPFVQKWRELECNVVLFGAGGHSHLLVNAVSFPSGLISAVVDSNPTKQGKLFEPLGLTIRSPKMLQELKPDVVIVSSRAYQEEMINQLIQELATRSQIMKLYPHVGYVANGEEKQ